jgi:hypothetical protein
MSASLPYDGLATNATVPSGAGEMDTPRGELDEKQDVEGLQEHRLDREEVAGERSLPLCSEELVPRWTPPTRRRPEVGLAKDPPDGARSEPGSPACGARPESSRTPISGSPCRDGR